MRFRREVNIPRFKISRIVNLIIKRINKRRPFYEIISRKIRFNSKINKSKKSHFPRSNNTFIRKERNFIKEKRLISSSSSENKVNMRISIKFSSKSMNNRE